LTEGVRNSWGFSLFCDDIRSEVGAKMSVMGIYGNEMVFPLLPDFPFSLAKFAILVKYYEIKNTFTDDLIIRVFFPGDPKDAPSVQIPIARAGAPLPPDYPIEEDQQQVFTVTFPIVLSPFPVKQEGFVKVRVACGEHTTNLGSLMIRKIRENEAIQFPGFPPPLPPPGQAVQG